MFKVLSSGKYKFKITQRFYLPPIRMVKINGKKKTQVRTHVVRSTEKDHYFIVDGIENWYNHSGNQSGGFLENWNYIYLKTQLYHSYAYTQKMFQHVTRAHAPLFS